MSDRGCQKRDRGQRGERTKPSLKPVHGSASCGLGPRIEVPDVTAKEHVSGRAH